MADSAKRPGGTRGETSRRGGQTGHTVGLILDGTLSEEYVRTATGRRSADRVIWTGLGRVPNSRADVPTIVVEFVSAGTRNCRRDYT